MVPSCAEATVHAASRKMRTIVLRSVENVFGIIVFFVRVKIISEIYFLTLRQDAVEHVEESIGHFLQVNHLYTLQLHIMSINFCRHVRHDV